MTSQFAVFVFQYLCAEDFCQKFASLDGEIVAVFVDLCFTSDPLTEVQSWRG